LSGHSAALSPSAPDGDGLCRTRHLQLEVFGLPLPCAVEETIYYGQQQEMMYRTEAQALTLARLQGLRALHDAFPDAEIFARGRSARAGGSPCNIMQCIPWRQISAHSRPLKTQ